MQIVALHPEGVDRNLKGRNDRNWTADVALHPEGVDRNLGIKAELFEVLGRPPPGGRG